MRMSLPARHCALLASLLASTASLADDGLGRLFFTPAERAALDARLRRVAHPPPPSLDGLILPSGGTPILILDGRTMPAGPTQRILDAHSIRIRHVDGKLYRLQVGTGAHVQHTGD